MLIAIVVLSLRQNDGVFLNEVFCCSGVGMSAVFQTKPHPIPQKCSVGADCHRYDHLVLSGRNIEVAKLERDVIKLSIVAINATGLPLLLIEYSYEFSILFIMVYTKQMVVYYACNHPMNIEYCLCQKYCIGYCIFYSSQIFHYLYTIWFIVLSI